jgi:hypothetical protein
MQASETNGMATALTQDSVQPKSLVYDCINIKGKPGKV